MRSLFNLIILGALAAVVYFTFFGDTEDLKQLEYQLTTTKISTILEDPTAYEGEPVTVAGEVLHSFSLGVKFYAISDGTGTLYILTQKAVPLEGETVKVKGIFSQFIKLGTKQYSVVTEAAP